jgi:hypothetical protein
VCVHVGHIRGSMMIRDLEGVKPWEVFFRAWDEIGLDVVYIT